MANPTKHELSVRRSIATSFKHGVKPELAEVPGRSEDLEAVQIAQKFAPFTWSSVPASLIEHEYAGIHILSDVGFLYYLPRYMLVALDVLRYGLVAESVISALTPSEFTKAGLDRRKRVFTRQQRVAIVDFLTYISSKCPHDFENIEKAIGYWS